MFAIGDKVVCVYNDSVNLIPGKTYTISNIEWGCYFYLKEISLNISFFEKNFVSLSVNRKDKLLKLKNNIKDGRNINVFR